MNTVLYNRIEGINNAVNKRQGKTSLSSVSATEADSLFDRKIDLVAEGIESFFGVSSIFSDLP